MNRRDWLRLSTIAGAGLLASPLKGFPKWSETPLTLADFGPDFAWGVATAAYQIEGAWNLDGKGPSIWDHFTHRRGKIHNNENGDVTCDYYHRYPQDLELMRSMSIPNNRFSLSWSRLFPEGVGTRNEKGFDFYDRVIDTCLEKGLRPWITLYHWDLPQALEEKGGWTNRSVVDWFLEYADAATRRYGDRVKDWMILNEPMAYTGLGYFVGMHAPGRRGLGNFLPAVHHTCLVQGDGGRLVRSNVPDANIGTTFSASYLEARSDRRKDLEAMDRVDKMWNRLFIEPSLGMGYPTDNFPALSKIHKHIKEGDEARLAFDFDFIGLQNYTREVVKKAMIPYIWANFIKPDKRGVSPEDTTLMGWEVYPEGIYHLLKKFAAYPKVKKILVTENGSAFEDHLVDGKVHDPKRLAYLQDYLKQVLRAKQEGVPVEGYFAWTFMDNFEWAEGYHPRFGLVHVDFESQQRTIKNSGLWFRDFLQGK